MAIPIGPPTQREAQILRLLAAGHTKQSAARILFLSPHTVHTHTRSLLRRLDARSAAQAVAIAYENDWWGYDRQGVAPPKQIKAPPKKAASSSSAWSMTTDEIAQRWPSTEWSTPQWTHALSDPDLIRRIAEGMRSAAVRRDLWRVRRAPGRAPDGYAKSRQERRQG